MRQAARGPYPIRLSRLSTHVALPALLPVNGIQAAVSMSKLQLTRKYLAASQLLSVQQAMQLNQQGQQLSELSTRCKQLEQQLLATQQQVSCANSHKASLGVQQSEISQPPDHVCQAFTLLSVQPTTALMCSSAQVPPKALLMLSLSLRVVDSNQAVVT